MKFEVVWMLENGIERSFITEESGSYNPERKLVNGLHQIGFVKEGKTRKTWIPYKPSKYTHNVLWIKVREAYTGRVVERIECVR